MSQSHRRLLWLSLITLLAATLRFYRLGSLPPGLWFDEAWFSLKARDVVATRTFQVYFDLFGISGITFPIIYLTALTRALTGNDPLAVRYTHAALGVLSIPLTFLALRAIFHLDNRTARNDRPTNAALLGALILSLNFPHLLLSRVGFDVVLPAISGSLTFLALAVASRTGRMRDYLLTGIALGTTVYSYQPARFLAVAVTVAVMWLALLARDWRPRLTGLALAAAVSMIIATPLGLYFLQHPGAFTARAQTTTYNTLGPGAPSVPLAVLNNLLRTLAGFSLPGFGDVIARHNIPGHPVFDAFLSLIFWLGVVMVMMKIRRHSVALLASWAGVMLLPVILTDGAPVFTRLLGAMPALAGICALGGCTLFDVIAARSRRAASALIGFGLLFSLTTNTYDYFVRWANDPRLYDAFQIGDWEAATLARDRAESGIVYLAPDLINDTHPTFDLLLRGRSALTPSEGSPVRPLPLNCLAYFNRPARPLTYLVDALNDNPLIENLSVQFPTGRLGEPILHQPEPFPLYEIFEVPRGAEAVEPPIPATAKFGPAIKLIGYSLNSSTAPPGGTLTLMLYWQAETQPEADYTAFIHLFAPGGETSAPAAQSDSPPCAGDYPTSRWAPGEIVVDTHTLTVPPDYTANSARLVVGLYAWPSLDRLPITDTEAPRLDNRLLLAEIPISR